MPQSHDTIRAIRWAGDHLLLLDQRCLPQRREEITCRSAAEVAAAIRDMVVRGAPAIGITAAWGVVLAAQAQGSRVSRTDLADAIAADLEQLAQARPTAVNLAWALQRMRRCLQEAGEDPLAALRAEAAAIHEEDIAANRRMGELGSALMDAQVGVLTHCNTGSLATGGYGTALGVIRSAWAAGKVREVYADETRPWLQGARLTAWELVQDGIPVQLIAEGAAAWLMQRGAVDWVVVGSDRIAANGDVANKIGTYGLAVLARHHGVRFMVVAPTSTVDLAVPNGQAIPIEMRTAGELLSVAGHPVAAAGAGAWNPVFDVTPASLVDVIVTERGVVRDPDREKILAMMNSD